MLNRIGKSRYLRDSVIQYGGRLIYVVACPTEGSLTFSYLDEMSGPLHTVKLTNRKLDINPIELGYMNMEQGGRGAIFLCRAPSRQWRQGLTGSTLRYVYQGGLRSIDPLAYPHDLIKLAQKSYPTFERAGKLAMEAMGPVAFDRYWAIDHKSYLHYKGTKVGEVILGTISLNHTYRCLLKLCQEAIYANI